MRNRHKMAMALTGITTCTLLSLAAVAGPAQALGGNPTCLASGSTCMRIANNNATNGNPIVEGSNINGPASNMVYHSSSNTLEFTGHPGKCVGLNSADTDAVVQPCNGGHGIINQMVSRGCCGAVAFINNAATNHFGTEEDLTAVNVNGFQIGTAAAGAQGAFQRWK